MLALMESRKEMPAPNYDAIVARFERPLLAYAQRLLRDRERAREIVQDTFIALQRQEHDVPAKWLFKVCRNAALNALRKDRRTVPLHPDSDEQLAPELPPDEQLAAKESATVLFDAVATLPLNQQEVLQLKFQNDLSYAEISEITGLTINHVGVLIHNALVALRRRYAVLTRDPITAFTHHEARS